MENDHTGNNFIAGNQQNSLSNICRFTPVEKNIILKLLKICKTTSMVLGEGAVGSMETRQEDNMVVLSMNNCILIQHFL